MDKLISSQEFTGKEKLTNIVKSLLQQVCYKKLVGYHLTAILVALNSILILSLFPINEVIRFLLSFFIYLLIVIAFINSKDYRLVNTKNMVEHINRNFSQLEESAQLLLLPVESLSLIQRIQLQRITKIFYVKFNDGSLRASLPKIKVRLPLMLFVSALAIFLLSPVLSSIVKSMNADTNSGGAPTGLDEKPVEQIALPKLITKEVKVVPPRYTNLEEVLGSEMNLELVENSAVSWSLEFSRDDVEYYFIGSEFSHSNADRQKLIRQKSGRYLLEANIEQTSIYRIVYLQGDKFYPLTDVYSLEVISDKSPKIKIIKPRRTLIELAKHKPAEFELKVLVSDDYGIEKVRILASVAKGSGEAVKFRDKVFEFANFEQTQKGRIYQKNWSLLDLDMEPGDEVYFNLIANDNKQPIQQQSKSTTVIVRWLDDAEIEMAAEGIRIGFVPEYFRSQRQIIIETEQLIQDKEDLTNEEFNHVSTDLGHSQQDLKQKYGQYLGDEVGEGPGEQFGLADGYHGGEESHSGEASTGVEQHDDEEEPKPGKNSVEVGHSHQESVEQVVHEGEKDLSGKSQLISRFAHNHGSIEIGPMSKRDPKSWMKKAVNEMWQAELHLMLSEPEKALEYEYLAYKYLKLARQADRIYAKRLGFEPPPVSEDKRLSGELLDILNYSLSLEDKVDKQKDNYLFQQAHQLLTQQNEGEILSSAQKKLVANLRQRLLELAKTRPVLIKYAATLERILIAQKLVLNDCQACVSQLSDKLWQLLPRPMSLPLVRTQTNLLNNSEINSYLERVKLIKSSADAQSKVGVERD